MSEQETNDVKDQAAAYTVTSRDGASLRTDRWRYNRWGENAEGGNEELYDHDNDPEEFHNLVRDPTYAAALDRLRMEFEQIRRAARRSGPAP